VTILSLFAYAAFAVSVIGVSAVCLGLGIGARAGHSRWVRQTGADSGRGHWVSPEA
jgi:hypothetical protein